MGESNKTTKPIDSRRMLRFIFERSYTADSVQALSLSLNQTTRCPKQPLQQMTPTIKTDFANKLRLY